MIRTPRLSRPAGAFHNTHIERVRFGDTDAAGIVYYANYYRWIEAGRAELMRAAGMPYAEVVTQAGLFMPVVECWCRYRRPAHYDEELQVTSWIHELRSASVLIGCEIRRGETTLAVGASRLGCVDAATGDIRRLPDALRGFLDVPAD